jgi:FtsP/CotA-like multicopper oxidase with cupredoxin domain
MMMMAGRMTINGIAFDPLRVNEQVNLNTTEEWEFRNAGAMDHPMHLHVNPFQIAGQTDDSWHDVVLVPRGQTRSIRVTFREYPGRTMYHCHILDHEDMGMMGIVEMLA